VRNRVRREFEAAAKAGVPRWSPDGRWLTYSRPGGAPWWSIENSSDPREVIVRDALTGAEAVVNVIYKANPGDYTWITNRMICSGGPELTPDVRARHPH
jgi:Tol biopolymer transport system component